MADPERVREAIREKALALGFDGAHFTAASLPPEAGERLNAFLDQNRHGEMDWLDARRDERASPGALWRDAKSAIVLTTNYGPDLDPMEALKNRSAGVISVYARNRDYHDIIKKRLKKLGRWMAETYGGELKVFVDTAPLMEKPLAGRAGAGWQGKHTNLVSREFGSWLFLGAILTTMELPPDAPEDDHCGSCGNCLDICPTDAFPAPYQLDARRCISYLTIEHKGPIPHDLRPGMGNRIYGCDDCLAVCPWNKFAAKARETALHARDDLISPPLADLAALDDAQFRKLFSGSPIKRTGRDRFVRNVAIAIGNSGDRSLVGAVENLLHDASALVRGAAIWAIGRIADRERVASLRNTHAPQERDADVQQEWALAVNPDAADQGRYSSSASASGTSKI